MKNPFYRNTEFLLIEIPGHLRNLGYEYLGCEGSDGSLIFGGFVCVQAAHFERPELIYTIQFRRQGNGVKWLYDRVINPEVMGYVTTGEKK